jgi:hypothetical protein
MMRGRILDFALSLSGKQRLTLELDGDFRESFDKLSGADVEVTVRKHRERRSLDANAYCWVLIDKLAEALRLSKAEIYRSAIRDIGGVSETVCVKKSAADRLCDGWTRNGLGWQAVKFPSKLSGCVNVTLYYGSSTYDSRQMAALIDNLVQDCRAVGIETKSPQEIKSLLGG